MMIINPNEEVRNIHYSWLHENNNVLIGAIAGSGKSTLLMDLTERINTETLLLAFNKSVQKENNDKIKTSGLTHATSLTMHSLGLRAIYKTGKKVKINNYYPYIIIKELKSERKDLLHGKPWKFVMRVTYILLLMYDDMRIHLLQTFDEITDKVSERGIKMIKKEDLEPLWESFMDIVTRHYDDNVLYVDFNDMLYIPVKFNLPIPVNPTFVMVDECQDFNELQHTLFQKIIKNPSVKKWIAVGDEHQSIYEFAGAKRDSFHKFKTYGDVKQFPLTTCYRCSKAVIDSANEVYGIMKYGNNREGEVKTIYDIDTIKDNCLVVCRNTAPLLTLYFELLSQERKVTFRGKAILSELLTFLKKYEKSTIDEAYIKMNKQLSDLSVYDEDDNKAKFRLFKFSENFTMFELLEKKLVFPIRTIKYLIMAIDDIFTIQAKGIILSTIHKAKGDEDDYVYILNENLIPSSFATTEEQLVQEENLRYVARTRAKIAHYFLNL